MKIIQVFANHKIISFQNLNPPAKIGDLICKCAPWIFDFLEAKIFSSKTFHLSYFPYFDQLLNPSYDNCNDCRLHSWE